MATSIKGSVTLDDSVRVEFTGSKTLPSGAEGIGAYVGELVAKALGDAFPEFKSLRKENARLAAKIAEIEAKGAPAVFEIPARKPGRPRKGSASPDFG